MAKDVSIIVGGTGLPQFPNCDSSLAYGAPYAREIAWEYARGYFTLSKPVNPSLMEHQRTALSDSEVGEGSVIYAIVIPARHLITSAHVVVRDVDAKMAGLSLAPVFLSVPVGTNTATETTDLSKASAITVGNRGATYLELEKPIYTGENSYIFGLKITAMPTDTTVSLGDMKAVLDLVVKAEDFASHQQE